MKRLAILIFLFGFYKLPAQQPQASKEPPRFPPNLKSRVYGKLLDAQTGKPVEFAAVAVFAAQKDSILGGALADDRGEFNVENLPPFGQMRLRVIQLGYKKFEIRVQVSPARLEQDLGDLKLSPDEQILQEVEVTTEKSAVNISIDKRTYNVDKDLSVKGGTAVDAMKNVPGLTVDGEGNVQLRNQSPIIFVDGRPTNLSLQQIPADQIERIEVITNPGVRYDAAATGGILNIVMKRNLKPGYSGMVMAYAGTGDRYGGMMNLNVKEGKWNFTAIYSYNQAINFTKGYTRRTNLDSGIMTGYFNQDNLTFNRRAFNFGKIGVDYSLSNRSTLSLNQMISAGNFRTSDKQNFHLLDGERTFLESGERVNDQDVHFQHYNTQLQYRRTYPVQGKEFTADVNVGITQSENGYVFNTYSPDRFLQKNDGYSNAKQAIFQADYVNPLNETDKFEAGIRAFYKTSTSGNNTFNGFQSSDILVRDSFMSNNYLIDDMVNAVYASYSSKTIWDISYQAGLRFEHSFYKGVITDRDIKFSYNYPSSASTILKSLFPGVFFSKKLQNNQEWQLNFTRKIQRPNFFQLMPFVMFADRQNYRIGNPQLRPEFRNIAELNYSKTLSKGSYLGSGYFRYEEQPITEVAYPSENDPEVLVNTTINGDNSYRYGIEQTFKYNIFKKLDATINFNIYNIRIRGQVRAGESPVTASGYAFDAKAMLAYKFPKQITAQFNANYDSPRILLLGTTLPVYSVDFSLAKMVASKWTFNLTINDIFNTRRMGTNFRTPYYLQELSRRRDMRYVRFSISYMFGKMDASLFRKGKQRDQGGNDMQYFGG